MMSKIIIAAVIIIVGVFSWFFVAGNINQNTDNQSAEFEKMPAFSLQDYDGNTVNSEDLRGKYLIINSWAAWCPFCVEELIDFAVAQEEFKDRLVVIAINRAESLATAKKFTDEVDVTGRITLLLDPNDSFYKSLGGFTMPETIFVDKEGFIRDHKRGPMALDEIRQRVQKLVASN